MERSGAVGFNPFAPIVEKWRKRRAEDAAKVLDVLKIRHHTFRILLANNELALNILGSVSQALTSPGAAREDWADEIDELLDVSYELVDGLNRLTNDRHSGLYERRQQLEDAIRQAIEAVRENPRRMLKCIPFDELSPDYRALVGGKASAIASLKQAGIPVPDGFAITAEAGGEILSANGLDAVIDRCVQRMQAERSRHEEIETEAAEIREGVLAASIPEDLEAELRRAYDRLTENGAVAVSVRSSAMVEDKVEHTFAGQFESVLNVTSFEALTKALREVLASNYSARSSLYRMHAGLPLGRHDMAIFCQRMAQARTAGVLFTIDPSEPENGRMLISAVPGLGILAVGGAAPADIYRPLREGAESEPMGDWSQIAEKTHRAVSLPEGGVREEALSGAERERGLLSMEEACSLVRLGRMIENLTGKPQDVEWAISQSGKIFILQSRDVRLPGKVRHAPDVVAGEALLRGGVCASPGRRVGRVKVVNSVQDFEKWSRDGEQGPGVLVLHQSMVDAAGWIEKFEGVVVDLGNPVDHLSCIAREYAIPMLTRTGKATKTLRDGDWVVVDADRGMVLPAPEELWKEALEARQLKTSTKKRRAPQGDSMTPEVTRLWKLVEPLNLTDAYGPTFSIRECRSLHDLIRYVHEMAVLAMFDTGDAVLEEAETLVHRLDGDVPLHFMIIDLGGGVSPGSRGFRVRIDNILSTPLLALWEGITFPGLRWGKAPPVPGFSGLVSRSMLDQRGARPVGTQNYAMISRDYLNLNARVDYHFSMVDAVCGNNPRENYIRFRFKGGGTTAIQRERRARFVAEVLDSYGFFTDQRGDLVTASLLEGEQEEIAGKLAMIGRLLGFSRLLDATMTDDNTPGKVARAFIAGDYDLDALEESPAQAP